MVAAFIAGRLGNQMFHYAFSKAVKLAQEKDSPLIFDFHKYLTLGSFKNIICNGPFAVPALFEHMLNLTSGMTEYSNIKSKGTVC